MATPVAARDALPALPGAARRTTCIETETVGEELVEMEEKRCVGIRDPETEVF
jgi:hypothetical protein